MTKKDRAEFVLKFLSDYLPEPPIPLHHKDPYTLLIAVLLSAQCTDERVNQVTPSLFELADNPQLMSTIPVEQILKIVRPCGLGPQKAKAISNLSKILVEKHDGEVPGNLEDLEALPGVGHKTAQVVLAQAFKEPSFPVDTHIHRLAQRWRLTSGQSVVQTERDLKKLFPIESWNALHLQIIYFGRDQCHARRICDGKAHGCDICQCVNASRKTPIKTKKA